MRDRHNEAGISTYRHPVCAADDVRMSLPARTPVETDVRYDASVAGAMNRVLEAERAAQSAIADFELQMHASLEQARQRRRTILERAHERIMALHARAARARAANCADTHATGASAEPRCRTGRGWRAPAGSDREVGRASDASDRGRAVEVTTRFAFLSTFRSPASMNRRFDLRSNSAKQRSLGHQTLYRALNSF
jgi:hypothetical protein